LASRYIAAFMRASNAIYDVPEGRPIWKTLPIRIGVTVVVMVLLAVSAIAVVATGGVADRTGRLLGIGSAGVLALVGLAAALWSASSYIAAFMRASNAIYDVPEGRPVWKTLPIRIGVTVVVMVLLAVSAVAVVATGGLADRIGRLLGIGSAGVTAWDIVKWPVLLLSVSFMFALLFTALMSLAGVLLVLLGHIAVYLIGQLVALVP